MGAIARPVSKAIFGLVAAVLLASMLATALHDVSRAWDVGYYHLPFAGRLAGILTPEAYEFHPANQARFEGFPLFAERLQALLWRMTGRPESTNLVAFACVPLLAWFLRARFGVPWALSVLGLLAIPLVHMHSTSSYVDLPANAAASVVVLLAIEAYSAAAAPRWPTLLISAAAAASAANTKALLHPLMAAAIVAIFARAVPALATEARGAAPHRARAMLAGMAIALPIIFATPLANLIVHHNPYYPVHMTILGATLPGPEGAYSSSPPWLAHAARPVRFVCSLLEIGIRPFSNERRWSIDQWMPDDSTGNRMGGYFGAYVVFQLALFVWRAARDRAPPVRAAAIGFAALTALTSVMPQSHELRYYLSWMIVLVLLNLWLACRADAVPLAIGPRAMGAVSIAALVVVLAVTRGAYAYPCGMSWDELVRESTDARVIANIRNSERVCVKREPWNVLWAARFHAPKRYVVREAEEPADCEGARPLE